MRGNKHRWRLDLLKRTLDGLDYLYHCILAFVILGPGKTTGDVRVEGYDIKREACVTYVPCDVCMMKPASSDR